MKSKSKIILGTVQFGQKYGIYKNKHIAPSQIYKILNYAYKNNVEYLDTAVSYGKSNYHIKKFRNIYKNKKFKIITKIEKKDGDPIEQFNKIEKNIGTKPHTILCHNSNDFLNKNFRKKLFKLKNYGVKRLGVSVYSEKEINNIIKCKNLPDIIQLPLNIVDTNLLNSKILKNIKNKNIEIHARSVFFQGLFFLKQKEIIKIAPNLIKRINKINFMIKEFKLNLAQASFLWINSLKEVDKIVLGVKSLTELNQNLTLLKNELPFDKSFYLKSEFKLLNYKKSDKKIYSNLLKYWGKF